MSLNFFKTLSDLSGALSTARSHRARLGPGPKRRPARQRIVLEALEDRTLLSVWVATDQTDYAPGSTAIISGGGFQPDDAITLQVVHTDGNPNVSPANDPWTVTADDSGNVASTWYVDPASSAGDSLELQANDPATGDSAVADFTDSTAHVASVTTSIVAGTYGPGTTMNAIDVNFYSGTSGGSPISVTVTGSPTLALNSGGTATYNAALSTLSSGIVAFTYTTAAGQSTSRLDYSATTSLTPAGSIKNGTTGATLTLPTKAGASDGLYAANAVIFPGATVSGIVASPSPTKTVAPTFTANISDTLTSVTSAEYFVDGAGAGGTGTSIAITPNGANAWTTTGTLTGAQFNGLADGTHTIFVDAKDGNGIWGTAASGTFVVDKTGPVVSISSVTSPTYGYPVIAFTTSDAHGSATVASEYFLDTAGTPGTGTPIVTGGTLGINSLSAGSHTVYVDAEDAFGNWSTTPASFMFTKVTGDVTPPVTTSGFYAFATGTTAAYPLTHGWYNPNSFGSPTSLYFGLTATDSQSGVYQTYYTVNGGTSQLYSGRVAFGTSGVYTLNYWSVDKAGNTEAVHTTTLQLDNTTPTMESNSSVTGSYGSAITISGTWTAGPSGMSSITTSIYDYASHYSYITIAQSASGSIQNLPATIVTTQTSSTATAGTWSFTFTPLSAIWGSGQVANVEGTNWEANVGYASLSGAGGTTGNQINLGPGNGLYNSAPSVTFVGGGGSGATGTANVTYINGGGFVTSVTVNNGGSGYTSPPTVTFGYAGAGNAQGTAILDGSGHVIGVDMTTITITKANAVVNVTPYTVSYDGLPHSATGTATGVLAENLTSLLTINSTHTNPGIYTDSWSFAGNANYVASSGTFTDTITPTISSVATTTPSGAYDAGKVITITLNFNGPVFVTGTPQLALNSGGVAYYSSGSSTSALTFTYTVAAGDSSPRLDYTGTGALTLSSAAIQDAGNNNVSLTLPATQGSGDGLYSQNIVIDTTAPTVVEFDVVFGSQSYNLINLARLDLPWQITGIKVKFSEPVTGSSSSLTGTGLSGITYTSGSGTSTLTWSISTLTLGSYSAVLGSIADIAGNALSGSNTSESFKVLYGDFNGDGVVTSADVVGINNVVASGVYNIFADLNGDGKVDSTDASIARGQNGKHL